MPFEFVTQLTGFEKGLIIGSSAGFTIGMFVGFLLIAAMQPRRRQ